MITNQSVIRLRAPFMSSRYSDNRRNWDLATELVMPDWSVQPVSTSELRENRDTTVAMWVAFAPGDADIVFTDRIKLGSMVFEIEGEPQIWPDPINPGLTSHIELPLKIINPPESSGGA